MIDREPKILPPIQVSVNCEQTNEPLAWILQSIHNDLVSFVEVPI